MIKAQTDIVNENNEQVIQKIIQVTEPVFEVVNLGTGYLEKINTEGCIIEKIRIKSGTTVNLFNVAKNNEKEAM